MKTRLIFSALSLVAIALIAAFTMRPSIEAQEEPSEDDQYEDAPAETDSSGAGDESSSPEQTARTVDENDSPDQPPVETFEENRESLASGERSEESALDEGQVEGESMASEEEDAPAATDENPEQGEDDIVLEEEETEASVETSSAEGEGDKVVSGDREAEGVEDDGESSAGEPEELVFEADELDTEELDDMAVRHEDDAETVTVDFPDEEIRSILRVVADLFDLNLVIPETLAGRTSIKLHDVSWQQVFDVVLSPAGFTYIEEDNIIKVVSLESLSMEPPQTRVVILNYAEADEIKEIIEPSVSGTGGRIQVDSRTNALVISAPPTQLRRVERTIEELDQPNAQVMIESKFIETRNRNIDDIGVNWASLEGWNVAAGPFEHEYLRERSGGRTIERENSQQSSTNAPPNSTSSFSNDRFSDAATSRLTSAVFSADQFDVILSALRTTDDVKLVSNPTVVALNNQEAKIHIGEEFPVVYPRFNPQTGSYEAGEPESETVGIELVVTPHVNHTGFINLKVMPEVSTLTGTVSYFGAEYPIKSTRTAETEVVVKDGFTVAIGGLVQDDTMSVEQRVPVLGSIPVLGRLFRSTSDDNDQRNLIIFLTARTLSPDGNTLEETVDPRKVHTMGLSRDEVPGYRPDIPHWPDEQEELEDGGSGMYHEQQQDDSEWVIESPETNETPAEVEPSTDEEPSEQEEESDRATEEEVNTDTESEGDNDPVVEASGDADAVGGELETVTEPAETEAEPGKETTSDEADEASEGSEDSASDTDEEDAPEPAPRSSGGWLTPRS